MLSEAGNIEFIGCVLSGRPANTIWSKEWECECDLLTSLSAVCADEWTEPSWGGSDWGEPFGHQESRCVGLSLTDVPEGGAWKNSQTHTHTHSRNFNTRSLYSENKHLAARTRSKVEINLVCLFFYPPVWTTGRGRAVSKICYHGESWIRRAVKCCPNIILQMTPGCVIVLKSHKDTGPLFEENLSLCSVQSEEGVAT